MNWTERDRLWWVPSCPCGFDSFPCIRCRDCEDGGRCREREGPDGWCDSCVSAHLGGQMGGGS